MARPGRKTLIVAVVLMGIAVGGWLLSRPRASVSFDRAWVSLRAGRTKEVREQLDLMASKPEWQIHRRVLRAGLMIQAGNVVDALRTLPETASETELLVKILELRGQCLHTLGRSHEARSIYERLTELRPTDAGPHRALGGVYFDMGFLPQSKQELHKAIELEPKDATSRRILGRLELDAGQLPQAIEHLRIAVSVLEGADRDQVLVELATAEKESQQFAAASQTLQQLAKPSADALALQAECERALGNTAKAMSILEAALADSPADPKASLLRAQWHLEAQEPERAVALLLSVLAKAPFELECRYVLIQAYQRLKDDENVAQETQRWEQLRDRKQELDDLQAKLWKDPTDEASRRRAIAVAREIGNTRVADFWQRSRPNSN